MVHNNAVNPINFDAQIEQPVGDISKVAEARIV